MLGNKDLKQRHYKEIFALVNIREVPRDFSFLDMERLGILNKKENIDDISVRASGEALIEI
jgi:hypothetical protein